MRNIYKKKMTLKSKLIIFLSLVFAACIALLCGLYLPKNKTVASTATAEAEVFDEGVEYFNTYGIGETISIKKINAERNGEELQVFAYLQNDKQVVAELTPSDTVLNYVFENKGKYELIYFVKNADFSKQIIKYYSFSVNKQPYFKVDFAPSYTVGSVIDINKKCFYDLQSVSSSVTVTTPKGKTENVSGSFCANEAGFYEVKFSASIAGMDFSRTYLLDVRKKPTTYSEYFQPISGVSEIRADVSAPAYAKAGSGVAIYSNASECVFQYGNIIDLNALTKDDQLISLLPLAGDGITAMSDFSVKLIDVYDSSNVIEYYVYSDFNPNIYDQEWTYASIIYKGKNYAVRSDGSVVNNKWGAVMSVHIHADVLKEHAGGIGYGKAEWFCAQTDYANKSFHVNAGIRYNTVKSQLLMDLSNPEYVGFGNEWSGFTTGEVYLQVKMKNSSGTCGMIVSEVAGETMSGELSSGRMPAGFFLDSETNAQIPNAIVGLSYRVPEVSYYVDSLEGRVEVPEYSAKLYKEILSPILMEEIPLESGDKSKYSFVPTEKGQYRLVYTVSDQAGNAFSKDYIFTVEDKKDPCVNVDIDKELYVGEYFTIPKIEVLNMSQLTYAKESILYNGVEYSEKTGDVILLEKAGEIKIRCTYKDYLGQELKFEQIYEVLENDKPIINIDGNVPKYVLKGQSLVLPDFSAVTYKNGAATVHNESVRKITADGKEVDLTARKIEVTQAHNQVIKVVYSALDASQEFEIRVIDAKYLSDRFYASSGEFTSVENNKKYVELFFEEDVCVDFVNAIPVPSNADLGLVFSLSEFNFEYVDISFADFVNPTKSIFIRLTESRGILYAQLNGLGDKVVLTPVSEGGSEYSISYNSGFGSFRPLFTIDEYSNGYDFDFFPSSLIYLTFDFVGVSAPSSIQLLEVGGNKLLSFYDGNGEVEEYEDYAMPTLIREKTIYDLALTRGTVVTVPRITVASVFSGFTWAEITVVAPSGKVLVNGANAYNDNDILLEEYGAYTITYKVGYLGASQTITEIFNVRKETPVGISFKETVKNTIEVGDKIVIPELNITGMEEDRETKIYLITPDFAIREVKEKEKLTFEQQGIYKLIVVTSDIFNTYSKVFEITVEGEA